MKGKPKPMSVGNDLFEMALTDNLEVATGVHLIAFKRLWDFVPGQVVKIGIDKQNPPRIYSICSGKNEHEIRILFNIKEDGLLTPQLASMVPGEKILVSKPYGSFTCDTGKAVWVATGTGIAPFYSMLKSGLGVGKKLVHGVRFLDQFYFEDELEQDLNENYIRCCSKENACNVTFKRVTDYLNGLNHFPGIKYYICGKALMVVEVRDLLIAKGVPFDQIKAEIYF